VGVGQLVASKRALSNINLHQNKAKGGRRTSSHSQSDVGMLVKDCLDVKVILSRVGKMGVGIVGSICSGLCSVGGEWDGMEELRRA
jgi:hypothetical protein